MLEKRKMFEISMDATYPDKDGDILDPDALFEFMILSCWEKAQQDRFEEFFFFFNRPRPIIFNEENNPDGLMFQLNYGNIAIKSGSSFNIGYTIGLM